MLATTSASTNVPSIRCTCRCETYNGVMREHNLHSNRQASSRDITTDFAVLEQLQLLCEGGDDSVRSSSMYMYVNVSELSNVHADTSFVISGKGGYSDNASDHI